MKTFRDYLQQSKKIYEFKICVAGDYPEKFEDRMEQALNKYEVLKFSKIKTTPITESPLDFPRLRNTQVTHFEIELGYPTTSFILENYLTLELDYPDTHMLVRSPYDPLEGNNKEESDEPYEVLLTNKELTDESAQEDVGENRVMSLLKELETARKERSTDFATGESRE